VVDTGEGYPLVQLAEQGHVPASVGAMVASHASAEAWSWAAWALLSAVAGLVFVAVFFGGGSGDDSLPTLGSLAVLAAALAVAAAALGELELPKLDRAGSVAVLAAAGLVAWVGVSIVWSIAGDRSWSALAKGLVYLAFLILGLALAASLRGSAVRAAAVVLALILGAALGWALLGRAVPGLFPDGGRIARLREPVGYWNALALLAGTAVPLGLWLVTANPRRALRAAGGLLVYGAVLVVMLTQSRAGLLALVAGVATWLLLSRARLEGGLLGLAAAVPALAVAGWAFTRPALVEDGALRADRLDDGVLFAVLAVAGGVAAVALVLVLPAERLVLRNRRRVAGWLAGAALAVLVCASIALVAAVGNPVSWAGDQVSSGECVNNPGRITDLCANNRPAWWGDAVEVFRDHPLAGTGALTYEIARKRVRDDGTPVLEPHSVPLQLLSDLGAVGLALAAVFVGAVAVGVRHALGRLKGQEREAAAALACLPVIYAVHAIVDYDLDFIAVTAPTLVACGTLLGAARPRSRPGTPLITAAAAAVAAVAVVAVLVTPSLAQRYVDRSTRALDEGRLTSAAAAARRARSLDPLSLDPVFAAAAAADRAGDTDRARALYQRATEMQPENAEAWITLGLYELAARGDMCSAYHAFNAAYTLDPNGRQWVPGGPLDVTREAVNAGACER
jgi:hypothetical protein